jgi:hypothetical protein
MSTTTTTTYDETARDVGSDPDPESRPVDGAQQTQPEVSEKPSEHIQPQFPDGGAKAWLVVLGCWCTSFASFGIVNSFG